MITEISTCRLLIVSDLHLGNPFSKATRPTVEFLRWAAQNNYDVCINGDGFEIAQVSFSKIAYLQRYSPMLPPESQACL